MARTFQDLILTLQNYEYLFSTLRGRAPGLAREWCESEMPNALAQLGIRDPRPCGVVALLHRARS